MSGVSPMLRIGVAEAVGEGRCYEAEYGLVRGALLRGFRCAGCAGCVRVGRSSCETRARATKEALGLEEVLERDRLGMEQMKRKRSHWLSVLPP